MVTGAGGYLGGRLVRALADTGNAVRAISRHPAPWLPVPVHVLDLTADVDEIARVADGADGLIHLAGANQFAASTDPDRSLSDTAAAAHHVGAACAKAGVPRIVHASTVHVYGASLLPGTTIDEGTVPQPRAVYALSRLVAEHLLAMEEPELVVVRLTNGVGPPVSPQTSQWSLVANDLSRQAAAAGGLELHSDGQQYRDFVALEDVCRVLAGALDPERIPPGTYNFASEHPLTVRQLAELVQSAAERITGQRPTLRTMAPKDAPDDPYHVSAAALGALGFRAEVPLQDALEQTVRFCFDHLDALPSEGA